MPLVTVIGNLTRDLVAGRPPRPGGVVLYGGWALGQLGADARIVTRCAAEDRDVLLPELERLGPPVIWRPASTTATFSFHYEGDHRVMHVDAIGDPWTPEDVTGWAAEALEGAAWVHVGGLVRSDFQTPTLTALARGGRRLLMDAQGLVRPARTGPLVLDGDVDPAALATLSALKLSEEEALALTGSTEPDALRALGVPEVVLTLGSRGSLLVTPDRVERIRVVPAGEDVDPTGAGDVFCAAYLVERARGSDPVAAARAASAFVGDAVTRRPRPS